MQLHGLDAAAFATLTAAPSLSRLRLLRLPQGTFEGVDAVWSPWDTLRELDLTASDIDKEGARALAAGLALNRGLTALRLTYNPALDDEAKAALREAAAKRGVPLTLEL